MLRGWKHSGFSIESETRLLQKIYEVDLFICPKCQGTMPVADVIEDQTELTKIIEWAKDQGKEPQLTVCACSPPEPALMSV